MCLVILLEGSGRAVGPSSRSYPPLNWITFVIGLFKFSGMTHRGSIRQSYGGVGRNLGDALARLHCRPFLISAVGADIHARSLIAHNPLLDSQGLAVVGEASTAVYCVMLDQRGEALFGVGDMSIHDYLTPAHVGQFEGEISASPLVVMDGNLPQPTINYVLDLCASCRVPVWYEPTDIQKATKPWMDGRGQKVTFASPNLNELRSICSHLSLGTKTASEDFLGRDSQKFLGSEDSRRLSSRRPSHRFNLSL
ncbi:uncharacterized protein [Cherax quadricarinatus]|uniref:uncharacterized protein n=1 Tax=Cherax quadricarinatus TaxID=27406 RepID=UPI00387E944C